MSVKRTILVVLLVKRRDIVTGEKWIEKRASLVYFTDRSSYSFLCTPFGLIFKRQNIRQFVKKINVIEVSYFDRKYKYHSFENHPFSLSTKKNSILHNLNNFNIKFLVLKKMNLRMYLQYMYRGLGRPLSTRPCLVGHLRSFVPSHC